MTRNLPQLLKSIRVPRSFSPSQLFDLRNCALRVLAKRAERYLPPPPSALHGILLHHVREQMLLGRWGNKDSPEEAFDWILEQASFRLDELLAGEDKTKYMVPLRNTIGRRKWNQKTFESKLWAISSGLESCGQDPGLLEIERTNDGVEYNGENNTCEEGAEALVKSRSLRISGRADLIEKLNHNRLRITDFKSGKFIDSHGNPLPRYKLQLGLYALVAEKVYPGRSIELRLDGARRLRVLWDRSLREFCSKALEEASQTYPAGTVMEANALATPGSWCVGCGLRPRCQNYLNTVPAWWSNSGDRPRPLPIDVWGEVLETKIYDGATVLEMQDDGGRLIRIKGISMERDLTRLDVGKRVYFFDLKPTESLSSHGRRIHPLNFHDIPPDGGLVHSRATGLQIFMGES